MKMRSKTTNFVFQIKSVVLHKLLQSVAQRAYDAGHADGCRGVRELSRVDIHPDQMRKFL